MKKPNYCPWLTADFQRLGCTIWRWDENSPVLQAEDVNGVEIAYFDGLGWRKSKIDLPPQMKYKPRFRVIARAA